MELAESTRRSYQRRLDRDLNAIMVLAPANRHGKRLRKRYGRNRSHLFTFLDHPDTPPDNNGSERELRPTATYRKVTGGFRSNWAPICSLPSDQLSAQPRDMAPTPIKRLMQFSAAPRSSRAVEH